MKKRVLTIIIAFVMVLGVAGIADNNKAFAIGYYGANLDSANYTTPANNFPWGQCTWYAFGRALEKTGTRLSVSGNAKNWINWASSTTPRANSVAVWTDGTYGHVAFVEAVENGLMYITEANRGNQQTYSEGIIRMSDGYYTPSYAGKTNAYYCGMPNGYIYCGNPAPTNHAPEGCFRVAVGGEGTVYVRGWAYDPDDMSNQIAVDVYIGAPLGDGSAEGHRIRANQNDPEGHNSGANHGFSETITTNKRGNHIPVYCYAVDTTMTSNILLSDTCLYVNVVSDATAPTVSDLKVVSQDSNGYTLSCKVTDSGTGVNRVQFPTWTLNEGQDDLCSGWETNTAVRGTKNGDIYTFRVNKSDHKNEYGEYVTDVYAWDNAGNCTGLAGRIGVKLNAPHTHALVRTPAKAATTSSEGNIEYWTCSGCGKIFKDSAGMTEITKVDTVIPKLTPTNPDNPSVTPATAQTENVKADLPAVMISKPKAAKKAMTVKWKKVSKKNQKLIQGVEIQVATDKNFTNIVKSTTAGKKKTSKKIKGLKSKKTYYVRIRAYKNASDGKHVSAWKMKKVKVK